MPQKLRIPTHYYVYSDPPDQEGDETLHFVSAHRRVRMRGHSFREFVQKVVPLLNGTRTVEEIHKEVADLFAAEDLHACLEMLGNHGMLEDVTESAIPAEWSDFLRPQMNFFHDFSPEPEELQQRLMKSRVTVFGLGSAGASCTLGLAATGVGFLDCVDSESVTAADTYFSPVFRPDVKGKLRTELLGSHLKFVAPRTSVRLHSESLSTDEAVGRVIEGSQFVVNCLDSGQSGLAYKVNRACLSLGVPFTSVEALGPEVILGPTVEPHCTACYLCYKMRSVACSENPQAEFAFQSFLDRRRQDDSPNHANLSFGVNIAAQMAGMEVMKALTSLPSTTARGRIFVLNLLDMSIKSHLVLRKPWCPACFADWENSASE
ncbi:MAG: TOMM precursor leader peptide-binding protein [Bryobacteraceae bacterium]